MDKKLKIYIGVFSAILAFIIFMEATKKEPINWFPSFASHHKIPYGTYVLSEEFHTLFKNTEVRSIQVSPYEFLQDSTRKGTYFFVNGAFNFGKSEFDRLKAFVARGNDVFLAGNDLGVKSFNLETKQLATTLFKENSYYKLLNKQLDTNVYAFDRENKNIVFSKIDSTKTTLLGKLLIKDTDATQMFSGVNFIRYKHGKGVFYLHTMPHVFTNYALLKDHNHQYVASVLSYIDERKPIFYDAYYKTGKAKITSPLHFVLSSDNLRWSYYTALFGVLFFVLFKAKRTQRIIPIIAPLKNQSLAFTRTIANMYYEKSDHKSIAMHKIHYFLEYIRAQFHLSTIEMNKDFFSLLALRSGNAMDDVEKLFMEIEKINFSERITKEQLLNLNSLMECFKKGKSRV